jgi:glutaredoxin 2
MENGAYGLMARLQNYINEAGNSLESMERELKSIEHKMYQAQDKQNWPQYEKFKKEFSELSTKVTIQRIMKKKEDEKGNSDFSKVMSKALKGGRR